MLICERIVPRAEQAARIVTGANAIAGRRHAEANAAIDAMTALPPSTSWVDASQALRIHWEPASTPIGPRVMPTSSEASPSL